MPVNEKQLYEQTAQQKMAFASRVLRGSNGSDALVMVKGKHVVTRRG